MDVEISEPMIGVSHATEEVHFSGGIRGAQTQLGWAIYPISDDRESDAIVFLTMKAHQEFAIRECGLGYLGVCTKHHIDSELSSMDIWRFGANLRAADSWAAVGHQASQAGDTSYATMARNLSTTLRSAGLRLRDISNGYHVQLKSALAEKKRPGVYFSNWALQDLHSYFQSLAAELCSARDYLASIAAIHVGASKDIDSLAKLERWLKQTENKPSINNPIIELLISALGSTDSPNWLRKLGTLRNKMIHRQPMSADPSASAFVLENTQTSLGTISKIRLGNPSHEIQPENQQVDPLINISQLSKNLEVLCDLALQHAKYPAELLHLVSVQNS